MREPGTETTEEFEVSEALENSELIGDSEARFERWDETDSADCTHRYYEEDVDKLEQWDEFTRQTAASKLTVCRYCGFIPSSRRY
jgi:hypothetical protein